MQDPVHYLRELGVTVPDLLDAARAAHIDTTCLISMNYETFLFADTDERKRFTVNPTQYCGALTDPVTLQRFVPIPTSPHLVQNNRIYYFWSDSTRSVFELMPDMYATPHYKMLPNPDSTGRALQQPTAIQ